MGDHILAPNDLTQQELRRILSYDKETGVFTWKHRPECPTYWNTRYAGKPAGVTRSGGYKTISIMQKKYRSNRLAWFYETGEWPKFLVDHKNTNASDDSFSNLRQATQRQNQYNRGKNKNNTSGYKGVHFHKKIKMYIATIRENGKKLHIGSFATAKEASAAYILAAKKIAGEFASS